MTIIKLFELLLAAFLGYLFSLVTLAYGKLSTSLESYTKFNSHIVQLCREIKIYFANTGNDKTLIKTLYVSATELLINIPDKSVYRSAYNIIAKEIRILLNESETNGCNPEASKAKAEHIYHLLTNEYKISLKRYVNEVHLKNFQKGDINDTIDRFLVSCNSAPSNGSQKVR